MCVDQVLTRTSPRERGDDQSFGRLNGHFTEINEGSMSGRKKGRTLTKEVWRRPRSLLFRWCCCVSWEISFCIYLQIHCHYSHVLPYQGCRFRNFDRFRMNKGEKVYPLVIISTITFISLLNIHVLYIHIEQMKWDNNGKRELYGTSRKV